MLPLPLMGDQNGDYDDDVVHKDMLALTGRWNFTVNSLARTLRTWIPLLCCRPARLVECNWRGGLSRSTFPGHVEFWWCRSHLVDAFPGVLDDRRISCHTHDGNVVVQFAHRHSTQAASFAPRLRKYNLMKTATFWAFVSAQMWWTIVCRSVCVYVCCNNKTKTRTVASAMDTSAPWTHNIQHTYGTHFRIPKCTHKVRLCVRVRSGCDTLVRFPVSHTNTRAQFKHWS